MAHTQGFCGRYDADMDLNELLRSSIEGLLREIVDGPPPEWAFVLNPGDIGLLRSLTRLSAEEASARPGGRSSIAAHVRHLVYGFGLMNRWAQGESPFGDSDYAEAWRHQNVTDPEWRELLEKLERDVRQWIAHVSTPRDTWDSVTLSGTIGSVVHLAYHVGAIRQLSAVASGPPAND